LFEGGKPPSRVIPNERWIADFGALPAHTEILLPLGGKHILSPKPLMPVSELVEFLRREVSGRREPSSKGEYLVCTEATEDITQIRKIEEEKRLL